MTGKGGRNFFRREREGEGVGRGGGRREVEEGNLYYPFQAFRNPPYQSCGHLFHPKTTITKEDRERKRKGKEGKQARKEGIEEGKMRAVTVTGTVTGGGLTKAEIDTHEGWC
jgi:hypothetical protein